MPYETGSWFALPGEATGFAVQKPSPRPVILKSLGGRPYGHGFPRSATSREGLTHEPHLPSDEHPGNCAITKPGRILMFHLLTIPACWLNADTYSCAEPDKAVVDAVRSP
jgi:hypothetical protein